MCGITGFLDLERATAPDVMAARVDAMTQTLAHRGPDGEGGWTDAAAGVLRQVLYSHVPPELVERPKKGFSAPLASWLRGPLREWAEHLLDRRRPCSQGFFEVQPIRGMWHAHRTGRQDWSTVLWNILMFQSCLDRYGTATTGTDHLSSYRPIPTTHDAPLAVAGRYDEPATAVCPSSSSAWHAG